MTLFDIQDKRIEIRMNITDRKQMWDIVAGRKIDILSNCLEKAKKGNFEALKDHIKNAGRKEFDEFIKSTDPLIRFALLHTDFTNIEWEIIHEQLKREVYLIDNGLSNDFILMSFFHNKGNIPYWDKSFKEKFIKAIKVSALETFNFIEEQITIDYELTYYFSKMSSKDILFLTQYFKEVVYFIEDSRNKPFIKYLDREPTINNGFTAFFIKIKQNDFKGFSPMNKNKFEMLKTIIDIGEELFRFYSIYMKTESTKKDQERVYSILEEEALKVLLGQSDFVLKSIFHDTLFICCWNDTFKSELIDAIFDSPDSFINFIVDKTSRLDTNISHYIN